MSCEIPICSTREIKSSSERIFIDFFAVNDVIPQVGSQQRASGRNKVCIPSPEKIRAYMKIQFYCKALLCSSALLGTIVVGQADPILWTGPAIFFTDPAGGDPSLAVNQDRITPDIWITRGSFQGIYNAESEGGFTHFFSPQGTEWANGTLANYSSLTYTDWNTWAKNVNGGPPSTVGVSAVMHIIPDDIYISVEFTSWGGSEGGFSYMRSTPATVPEPSAVMLLAVGLALCSVRVLRPKNCSQG